MPNYTPKTQRIASPPPPLKGGDDTRIWSGAPIFPLAAEDVSSQADAIARDRDAHLGTLVIGLFLGAAISSCSILIGAWVIA